MPKNLGNYNDIHDIATKKDIVTYDEATISESGLMTPAMVTKLNNISTILLSHPEETSIKNTAIMLAFLTEATSLLSERDTNITISFEAKSDIITDIDCCPRTDSNALTAYTQLFTVGVEWEKHTVTMSLPADDYVSYTFRSNTNVGSGGSATANVSIRNIVITWNESPLINTVYSPSIIPMDNTIYDLDMTGNLIINIVNHSALTNGSHFILKAGSETRTLTISGATKITGSDYTGGLAPGSVWEISVLRGNIIIREMADI